MAVYNNGRNDRTPRAKDFLPTLGENPPALRLPEKLEPVEYDYSDGSYLPIYSVSGTIEKINEIIDYLKAKEEL